MLTRNKFIFNFILLLLLKKNQKENIIKYDVVVIVGFLFFMCSFEIYIFFCLDLFRLEEKKIYNNNYNKKTPTTKITIFFFELINYFFIKK